MGPKRAYRPRWLATVLVPALVASLLASVPGPAAAAEPDPPPGATRTPPTRPAAARIAPAGPVTTEATQGRRGAGNDASPRHAVPPFGVPAPGDWRPTDDRPAGSPAGDGGPRGFREGESVEDVSART